METIGRTNDGNYLVELTEEELLEFSALAQAAEGEIIGPLWDRPPLDVHHDLAKTFKAISAWMGMKCRINELQFQVYELERILGGNHGTE